MPSTLFADMDAAVSLASAGTMSNGSNSIASTGMVEDQRALQIALEQFSMLNLNGTAENGHSLGSRDSAGQSASNSHSSSPPLGLTNGAHHLMNTADLINSGMGDALYGQQGQDASKRSQNMTECVPVPSSEHVAEIVGRQGCKIKALRAKTNTYIKTPVRGEEPVFVVTGRREDVGAAKHEILSAAEHFSQIRAQRKSQSSTMGGCGTVGGLGSSSGFVPCPPNAGMPGQLTIQVRVPYRVVGLVVGPKGATIKRIQQQTNTYIITPSREKEPIFEVTGNDDNVEAARKEIEMHIAIRTGGIVDTKTGETCNDFASNGIDTWNNEDAIGSIGVWKAPDDNSGGAGGRADGHLYPSHRHSQPSNMYSMNDPPDSTFTTTGSFGVWGEPDEGISSPSTTFEVHAPGSGGPGNMLPQTNGPMWPTFNDDGSFFNAPKPIMPPQRSYSLGAANCSDMSPGPIGTGLLNGSSAPGSDLDIAGQQHLPARRMRSDPMGMNLQPGAPVSGTPAPGFSNGMPSFMPPFSTSIASSPTDSTGSSALQRRNSKDCILCGQGPIVAALVPCGHNLFCMNCAARLTSNGDANLNICPICNCKISQAIRIFS